MASICGRNGKAGSLTIKGKNMQYLLDPSQPQRASPDPRLQTLVQCWEMRPCTHTSPTTGTEACGRSNNNNKKRERENRTHRTCGVVARTSEKCSQTRPDTYAGLQPNPRASSLLRRLRKSRPTPQWFCCHYPRRPPWCRSKLPVCFSPPPQAEIVCSAVAPR